MYMRDSDSDSDSLKPQIHWQPPPRARVKRLCHSLGVGAVHECREQSR